MFKSAFFSLMCMTSISSFAQNSRLDIQQGTGFLYLSAEGTNNSVSKVEGSPYLDPVYYPSKVSGVNTVTPPMRYNAYKDEMEFVLNGSNYYVTKADGLAVKLMEKTYVFVEHPTDKGDRNGYLVALLNEKDTKFSVFKKEKVILIPEYNSGSGYRDAVPAHYKADEEKYYLGNEGKIIFMPKKDKDIVALSPSHEQEIKNFLKQNKISLKREADMVKLFAYMNTLK